VSARALVVLGLLLVSACQSTPAAAPSSQIAINQRGLSERLLFSPGDKKRAEPVAPQPQKPDFEESGRRVDFQRVEPAPSRREGPPAASLEPNLAAARDQRATRFDARAEERQGRASAP
jgi:hypothetical protein